MTKLLKGKISVRITVRQGAILLAELRAYFHLMNQAGALWHRSPWCTLSTWSALDIVYGNILQFIPKFHSGCMFGNCGAASKALRAEGGQGGAHALNVPAA